MAIKKTKFSPDEIPIFNEADENVAAERRLTKMKKTNKKNPELPEEQTDIVACAAQYGVHGIAPFQCTFEPPGVDTKLMPGFVKKVTLEISTRENPGRRKLLSPGCSAQDLQTLADI
jgi:hypothetical protein